MSWLELVAKVWLVGYAVGGAIIVVWLVTLALMWAFPRARAWRSAQRPTWLPPHVELAMRDDLNCFGICACRTVRAHNLTRVERIDPSMLKLYPLPREPERFHYEDVH